MYHIANPHSNQIFNDDITGSHDMMVTMTTSTSNIEMVRVLHLCDYHHMISEVLSD